MSDQLEAQNHRGYNLKRNFPWQDKNLIGSLVKRVHVSLHIGVERARVNKVGVELPINKKVWE